MTGIHDTHPFEELFAANLREMAVAKIREMPLQEAADALGLAKGGVEALLWETAWSLETAVRSSLLLNLSIEAALPSPQGCHRVAFEVGDEEYAALEAAAAPRTVQEFCKQHALRSAKPSNYKTMIAWQKDLARRAR